MATVEHSTLTTGELHEPKGIATAQANTVYIADGAGSGNWRLKPNGYCFYDSDSGTTISSPSSYTLINVATANSGVQREFSNNAAGRLTYTGTSTIGVAITGLVSYDHTGTGTNIKFRIHVNGSPVGPQTRITTGTAIVDRTDVVKFQTTLNTNDYVEVYATCSSGDLKIKVLSLDVEGII